MKRRIKSRAERGRVKRHHRIRRSIFGTKEKPRLSVHRSYKALYVQFIDDLSDKTLLSCRGGGNIEGAKKLGATIANEAKKIGIERIVFDRGGYLYHGSIKALADAAREAGLKF